jgi:hypothetical protein
MRISMILATVVLAFASACSDDANTKKDAGVHDAGPDAPPDASCFTNPTTHNEIINACTTAQKIYKDSHPPLLNSDGSLPPLP